MLQYFSYFYYGAGKFGGLGFGSWVSLEEHGLTGQEFFFLGGGGIHVWCDIFADCKEGVAKHR